VQEVAAQQQQHQGPVSRDSLVKETEHCRVWWDAKGAQHKSVFAVHC
jgi:hypothetical protein